MGERHRLDLVVGDVDRRCAEIALEMLELGAHMSPQLRIEVGQGFVHQETGWACAPSPGPGRRAAFGRRRIGGDSGRDREVRSTVPAAAFDPRPDVVARQLSAASADSRYFRPRSYADRARRTGTPSRRRDISGSTLVTSRSPMRMLPLVIVSSPAIIRRAVVLPHPDGPSSTRNSPSSDIEIEALHDLDGAKGFADVCAVRRACRPVIP